MALVEAQVTALELERVIPKIRTLFERDDKFFANIKKRDVEKISNRQMRVPLELRPGGSFQYFNPDGGDLGRGGGPTFDKAVLSSVFVSENIEYTKLAQWAPMMIGSLLSTVFVGLLQLHWMRLGASLILR